MCTIAMEIYYLVYYACLYIRFLLLRERKEAELLPRGELRAPALCSDPTGRNDALLHTVALWPRLWSAWGGCSASLQCVVILLCFCLLCLVCEDVQNSFEFKSDLPTDFRPVTVSCSSLLSSSSCFFTLVATLIMCKSINWYIKIRCMQSPPPPQSLTE